VVKVGDFVELSPVPGEELNRLVQVAALWSEPTQARQRMLASCHRFYRASVCLKLLLMHSELWLWALTRPASQPERCVQALITSYCKSSTNRFDPCL